MNKKLWKFKNRTDGGDWQYSVFYMPDKKTWQVQIKADEGFDEDLLHGYLAMLLQEKYPWLLLNPEQIES